MTTIQRFDSTLQQYHRRVDGCLKKSPGVTGLQQFTVQYGSLRVNPCARMLVQTHRRTSRSTSCSSTGRSSHAGQDLPLQQSPHATNAQSSTPSPCRELGDGVLDHPGVQLRAPELLVTTRCEEGTDVRRVAQAERHQMPDDKRLHAQQQHHPARVLGGEDGSLLAADARGMLRYRHVFLVGSCADVTPATMAQQVQSSGRAGKRHRS